MTSCCNPRGCDRFFGPRFAGAVINEFAPTEFLGARDDEGRAECAQPSPDALIVSAD